MNLERNQLFKQSPSLLIQVLWRTIPLTVGLLLLLAALASKYVTDTLRLESQRHVLDSAELQATKVGGTVALMLESCQSIADNDIVLNGVFDLEHRRGALQSYLDSLQFAGARDQQVAMVDYRGRPLAGEKVGHIPLAIMSQVLQGNQAVGIHAEKLILAAPVKYAKQTEAAILVQCSLKEFLQSFSAYDSTEFLAFSRDERIISSGREDVLPVGSNWRESENWLHAASAIRELPNVVIHCLESRSTAEQALSAVLQSLFFIGCVLILILVLFAVITSRLVTQPLNRILQQMERVESTGGLHHEVELKGAREFIALGQRFNSMLLELQQTTVCIDAFQRAHEQLELAMEAGKVGLWEWDIAQQRVNFAATYQHLRAKEEDAGWVSYNDFLASVHKEDRSSVEDATQGYLEGKLDRFELTFRVLADDMRYRWILSRGDVTRDSNGQPLRMIGSHIDVTERVEQQRTLEESNRELEQFAYIASHDLQEPLRKIAAFCELLREEEAEQLGEDSQKYLHYILDGASRMQNLIRDLLSYSRITTQGENLQNTDAQACLDNCLQDLEVSLKEKSARVQSDSLPIVWASPRQITQVFQNLIGNAIKYSEGSPVVHVCCVERSKDFVLSVSDNGIGISKRYHDKIFGIFKRLHCREEYPGTGIGLAICKRVVERWKGRIWVDSTPGKGSTFFFTVPKPLEHGPSLPGRIETGSSTCGLCAELPALT